MAIDTYAKLKTEVADYLARSDLDNKIPNFINLVEKRVNLVLRENGNEHVTTLTPDADGKALLPTDFYMYRSVNGIDNAAELEYLTPSMADARYSGESGATPRAFTIVAGYLFVYPSSTSQLILNYYRGVSELSDTNQSNWLLLRHPGIYLFGALAEASAYIEDNDNLTKWEGKLKGLLEDMTAADRSARWGKARSQVPGGSPC